MKPRVKVCCISSVAEAAIAVRHGAAALGLVSAMPSGPGVIAEETIAEIAVTVPPGVATFLLTSKRDADSIIAQQRRCRTNAIQLCDSVEAGCYAKLRDALPGISLVQVSMLLARNRWMKRWQSREWLTQSCSIPGIKSSP